MNSANFPRRRERKRTEAAERAAAWQHLTPREQLAQLDHRPGESKRQRARIKAKMEKAS